MPFTDYAGTPFVPHLLPVIPKGAPIASKIEPEKAGKIPGLREAGGWTGFKGWPSITTPEGVLAKWDSWYPDGRSIIGLRAAELPGVDMDADHPTAAEIVEEQARRHLGPAPKRGRSNSRKYLLMYRLKAGEPPITKKRIDFEDPYGEKYAIELLGRGQHYVIEGEHPSGVPYQWDEHPLRVGFDQLTEITNKHVGQFFTAVKEALVTAGFIITKGGAAAGGGNTSGGRFPIGEDHPDRCPDLNLLIDLLKTCPCDAPQFSVREDWFEVMAAIKAACGGSEAFYDEHVLPWCAAFPENEPDYVRGVWESVRDSALGWSYLCAVAQDFDWYGLVQSMFEVLPDDSKPADPTPPPTPLGPDEDVIAANFVEQRARKDWLYAPGDKPSQGVWRRCVDGIWIADPETVLADVSKLCCAVADVIRRNPRASREELNTAKVLHTAGKASSVLKLVRADPRIHAKRTEFDARPLIMGVPGGYIDEKGQLRPPDPKLLLSRCARCAPNPSVPCRRWKASMWLLCNGSPDLYKAMRRLIGYVMTGFRNEQIFVFLHGKDNEGGQGKTQFLRVLYLMLGGYATRVDASTFMHVKGDRRNFDISDMEGFWFAFASEINVGAEWAEARLKEVTGGDGMHADAKFGHGRDIDRMPALWFSGNHMPRFRDVDGGLRRRAIVLECERKVPKQDDEKDHALLLVEAEGPGIIADLLEMRREYLDEGLYLPPELTANAAAYFDAQDKLMSFLDDEAEFGAEYQATKTEIYSRYKAWCATTKHYAESRNEFFIRLERHQVCRDRGVAFARKRVTPGRKSNPLFMITGLKLVAPEASTIDF